jgi:hypothetical protein
VAVRGDRENEVETSEGSGAGEGKDGRAKGESLAVNHLPPGNAKEDESDNKSESEGAGRHLASEKVKNKDGEQTTREHEKNSKADEMPSVKTGNSDPTVKKGANGGSEDDAESEFRKEFDKSDFGLARTAFATQKEPRENRNHLPPMERARAGLAMGAGLLEFAEAVKFLANDDATRLAADEAAENCANNKSDNYPKSYHVSIIPRLCYNVGNKTEG